jgi:hypothetical protein
MIRDLVLLLCAMLLAGCASVPPPSPIEVTTSGPKFPRSQFDCGQRPLPPDPAKATGKTAAVHENRLGSWGEGCQGKLQSVGRTLDASGQVVDAGVVAKK